jgi:hypothetical protein
MQPAYEKIGVVDEQWIIHVGVPSLGNQVGQSAYPVSSSLELVSRSQYSLLTVQQYTL